MLPPSHTVATFYHLLLIEFLIILVLCAAAVALWIFWKRHGHEVIAEIGLQLTPSSTAWKIDADNGPNSRKAVVGRRVLTIGIGGMWMLDGLLQAQPALGTGMLQNVIQPVLQGQPSILYNNFLEVSVLLFKSRPLGMDSITVWIQLFIGLGILCGPSKLLGRLALRASIVWGLIVWVFGEGFGQIFTGETWLTGGPGSVLFYIFIAAILLRPARFWESGAASLCIAWLFAAQWLWDGIAQALPSFGYWSPSSLRDALLPMAEMHQPTWMSKPLYFLANAVSHHEIWWNALFVLVPILLFAGWFLLKQTRALHMSTAIVLAIVWWLCQDFGVIGGAGTDLNSGAPLLLLVISLAWLPATGQTPYEQLQGWLRRGKRDRRVPAAS